MTISSVWTDPDLAYLYREDPGLLAIADTVVEAAQAQTQPASARRWARPLSRRMLVVLAVAVIAVAGAGSALAVAYHLFGSGHSIDFLPATGQTPTVHDQQSVDGGVWSITTFLNPEGQTCFGIRVPEVATDGTVHDSQWDECVNMQQLFAKTPLLAQAATQRGAVPHGPGQWHDPGHFTDIAVWGIIDTHVVAKVELRLSTCELMPLQPDTDGIYETVLDTSTLATGVIPLSVLAYDGSGNLIATKPLYILEGAGATNLAPQPSCSG
jgi:hypothetical protein